MCYHWRTVNARNALFKVGRTDLFTCENCKGISMKGTFLIHHKDENGENNDPDNLEILCRGCHNKRHGRQKRQAAKLRMLEAN